MRIYVGNLPYDMLEEELQQEFEVYGDVASVSIMSDRTSGRPKGFAFVEMGKKSQAEAAIEGLNGKIVHERTLMVNEARPRTDSRGGGGYGGGRTGGYSSNFGHGGRKGGRSSGGRPRR